MTAAKHAWPLAIDFAIVDRRFGADAVNKSLLDPRAYAEAPRIDSSGRVRAKITREFTAKTTHREARDVTVRMTSDGALDFACSCGSRYPCEHVISVLADLAASPEFRVALGDDRDTSRAIATLDAKRKVAFEERTLDERLARWLPPRFEDSLEIDVEIARSSAPPASRAHAEEKPLVILRVRKEGSRALVKPRDLADVRLAPHERALLDLAVPSTLHKDAFVSTGAQASMLLHVLRDTPHTYGGSRPRRLRFSRDVVSPRLDADGDRLVARWITAEGRVVCDAADALLFAGPSPFLWADPIETMHPIAKDVDMDVALGLTRVPSLPLTEASRERVGRALLTRGRGAGVKLPAPVAFGLPALISPKFTLKLAGTPLAIEADLFAAYGTVDVRVTPNDASRDPSTRDLEAEEAAFALLREAHLVDDDGELRAPDERAVEFWERGLSHVRDSKTPEMSVLLSGSLANVRVGGAVDVSVRVGSRAGWLEADLQFTASALKVEMQTLFVALAANKKWIALTDGTLARITDDVAALIRDASPIMGGADHARIAPHHLGRMSRWLSRFGGDEDEAFASWKKRLRAIATRAEPDMPADLRATLRPYQREGLAWLQFLRALGAGGVLADDMGLGKTLTTLAFLQRWKEDAPNEKPGASIVVCPTSVVDNWNAEAERFTPGLRTIAFRGEKQADFAALEDADLVVTSYGIARRRIAELEKLHFRCAILDEAQHVKNEDAETTRAMMRFSATMRLALTGTPIENRLSELWSIMTFANPGILGTAAEFEDRFATPMAARSTVGGQVEELRAIVRPFVLRRTKASVLSDLPAKTEIDRVCELGVRQQKLYDALALSVRKAVRKDLRQRGLARSRISVLTAILRLRQMACDPRLVDPSLDASASAKRDAFMELARELSSEGRRTLVFSQFVELFTLWRADLDRERIAYEYLDGSTLNRAEIVDRFQRGHAPLFLVSLKAGGVGLNLTAADTVILCDPWWNPAVEDQATDRAHRIGQTKPVTVVRLIAKGTIEEKIGLLKQKKRDLVASILEGEGDASLEGPRALTEEDVERLLGDDALAENLESAQDETNETNDAEDEERAKPTRLTAHEIDDLRAMVAWLDRAGVPKEDLAKRVKARLSQLTLLLIGHRVPISRPIADRIRALYVSRNPATPPTPDDAST